MTLRWPCSCVCHLCVVLIFGSRSVLRVFWLMFRFFLQVSFLPVFVVGHISACACAFTSFNTVAIWDFRSGKERSSGCLCVHCYPSNLCWLASKRTQIEANNLLCHWILCRFRNLFNAIHMIIRYQFAMHCTQCHRIKIIQSDFSRSI